LRKEEGRVALHDGMLRLAEERNARLETDRARIEAERAAVEARFLERIAGLEELCASPRSATCGSKLNVPRRKKSAPETKTQF